MSYSKRNCLEHWTGISNWFCWSEIQFVGWLVCIGLQLWHAVILYIVKRWYSLLRFGFPCEILLKFESSAWVGKIHWKDNVKRLSKHLPSNDSHRKVSASWVQTHTNATIMYRKNTTSCFRTYKSQTYYLLSDEQSVGHWLALWIFERLPTLFSKKSTPQREDKWLTIKWSAKKINQVRWYIMNMTFDQISATRCEYFHQIMKEPFQTYINKYENIN